MQKKENKRNGKSAVLLLGLATVVGVAGISAYFTATDTATNTFNVQNVDVLLTEPAFAALTEEDKQMVPNKTVAKDPTVTNIGTADEFVFVSVKVPYANVITANADGTRNAAADIELFAWDYDAATTEAELTVDDAAANCVKGLGNGAVNDGWILVETNVGEIDDATGIGEVEYIYAYATGDATTGAMTVLAGGTTADAEGNYDGATTAPLFDAVTMCNAVENQGLELSTQEIDITVYAIQASDLKESGSGTVIPSEVLSVYKTQNGIQ